jgi:hypothetical protein
LARGRVVFVDERARREGAIGGLRSAGEGAGGAGAHEARLEQQAGGGGPHVIAARSATLERTCELARAHAEALDLPDARGGREALDLSGEERLRDVAGLAVREGASPVLVRKLGPQRA